MSRTKLGRGLDAILNAEDQPSANTAPQDMASVPVAMVRPNPFQPRTNFDEYSISTLAQSIRSRGMLQPVIVRQTSDGYQLVTGERRWRAAIQAGLDTIPARVVQATDAEMLELALVENIQREDLNPIEKAQAFKTYLEAFHLTQETLAERIGLDRTSITNFLRLLDLPEEIQVDIRAGVLSMGHGKALASISDPARRNAVWQQVVKQRLSVRQTEELAATGKGGAKSARRPTKTAHVRSIEQELSRRLGTGVQVREGRKAGTGTIRIRFSSHDHFQRLVDLLYQVGQ